MDESDDEDNFDDDDNDDGATHKMTVLVVTKFRKITNYS